MYVKFDVNVSFFFITLKEGGHCQRVAVIINRPNTLSASSTFFLLIRLIDSIPKRGAHVIPDIIKRKKVRRSCASECKDLHRRWRYGLG
jgi:hypothetical protein